MHYSQNTDIDNNKYIYSWQHYTGEYATDNIHEYLERKQQRETEKAFQERQDLADPVLYFPECVDSLNGIIGGNEEDDTREWGDFGDPEEPDSRAYTLKRNADGDGMNWTPLFKQVGIRLTVMHQLWGLVEGVITEPTEDGERTVKEASIKLINPQSVVDYYPREGNPRQVLVKEHADARSSIQDTEHEATEDVYVLYELGGWTRYRLEEFETQGGETEMREVILGQGEYEYYNDTDRTMRILPIFKVEIPMPRHVGYLLAKKQNHIFNKKSRRDFGVMNLSFQLLQLVADKHQYADILNNLDKGYNIIRLDPEASQSHGYFAPDSNYVSDYGEILEKDKEDFYDAAFKQYGDAAQVTATQVRLESRSGIEAFLSLLVSSIDEFEGSCFWRLMQVYFPDNTSAWGTASVKRSREFAPEDIKEAFEKLSTGVLNADRAEAISTEQKVRRLNPEMTKEEVEEEVERIRAEQGAVEVPEAMMGA